MDVKVTFEASESVMLQSKSSFTVLVSGGTILSLTIQEFNQSQKYKME